MATLPTSSSPQSDLQLEIAHLLLIDIVGYSKLLVNEQIESVQELARIVRITECFRNAEESGRLIRVPTGDGMALLFFRSPEEPVRCALEISEKLKENPDIQLRMGIHSGPVNQVRDVNDTINVAGTGINIAQRVMDCGDAGHILLSKHVADDLAQYRHWRPYLHDFGECEVKHGLRLHIVNLCKERLGNPALPEKLTRKKIWQHKSDTIRPIKPRNRHRPMLLGALSVATIGIAVVSIVSLRGRASKPTSAVTDSIPEKSIAVLPFENLSDDKQNAYFTDGVQDEILNDLAKVADLKVISRTSVMQYKGQTGRNLREIAKALGVANILEGSVQRSGNRVRVSAQLIDARNDLHIWAEHFDRDVADVFAIESELAEKIVSKLETKLSSQEKADIEQLPTHDLIAYDLYAHAKTIQDTSVFDGTEHLAEAARLLESAVKRDPNFFLAYCLLAAIHDELYFFGVDRTPDRWRLLKRRFGSLLSCNPMLLSHTSLPRGTGTGVTGTMNARRTNFRELRKHVLTSRSSSNFSRSLTDAKVNGLNRQPNCNAHWSWILTILIFSKRCATPTSIYDISLPQQICLIARCERFPPTLALSFAGQRLSSGGTRIQSRFMRQFSPSLKGTRNVPAMSRQNVLSSL